MRVRGGLLEAIASRLPRCAGVALPLAPGRGAEHDVGHRALTALVENCGRLERLALPTCGGVDDATAALVLRGLPRLRELCLAGANRVRRIEFGAAAKMLSVLDLRGCGALRAISPSFGAMVALRRLDLSKCACLLPEAMAGLKGLRMLNLSERDDEVLPEWLGELCGLTHLWLERCTRLKELPQSLGRLQRLESLCLRRCDMLAALPEGLGRLSSLVSLDCTKCHSLVALPASAVGLERLEELKLDVSRAFLHLPDDMGAMASLRVIQACGTAIQALPEGLCTLVWLRSLDLSFSPHLEMLPEALGQLPRLQELDLRECITLAGLPAVLPPSLRRLLLGGCQMLWTLPEMLFELPELVELDVGGLTPLVDKHCDALAGLRARGVAAS